MDNKGYYITGTVLTILLGFAIVSSLDIKFGGESNTPPLAELVLLGSTRLDSFSVYDYNVSVPVYIENIYNSTFKIFPFEEAIPKTLEDYTELWLGERTNILGPQERKNINVIFCLHENPIGVGTHIISIRGEEIEKG